MTEDSGIVQFVDASEATPEQTSSIRDDWRIATPAMPPSLEPPLPGTRRFHLAAPLERSMPWWEVLFKYSFFEAGDSAWSLIIVSTYFGTFLQAVLKEPGAEFGWAVTVGGLLIAVLSPLLGASADNTGRRQPYLRWFVLGAALCTAGLTWVHTVPEAMLLFIPAYICVNGAFTFFPR